MYTVCKVKEKAVLSCSDRQHNSREKRQALSLKHFPLLQGHQK